jgi:hypothetical protein
MKSRWGIVTCYIFLAIVFLIWNNAAKWVFLARVEWWAIAVLILVPLSALNALRSLFLGAYDLNDGREGFSVGFLLVVVSSSIAWTARPTEILGYAFARANGPVVCTVRILDLRSYPGRPGKFRVSILCVR